MRCRPDGMENVQLNISHGVRAMTTTEEWRAFLQKWSDEWLEADASFPAEAREKRWLGFEPATEQQVEDLETRLGYRLPPSYRAFLLTSNGWGRTSSFIERLRPTAEVEWLEVDDPQLLDAVSIGEEGEPFDGLTRKEYFSYRGPNYDNRHFAKSLKIADPITGDSAIYVLNPQAVAEDAEWEAWRHAHWIPGAERFPSFAHLMRAEYQTFRLTVLGDKSSTQVIGPFEGVYAPGRPRRKAKRIGGGRPRPRKLTVPELIERLEDPVAKVRLDAANRLFREYKPHDPDDERPELVEPLTRILRSGAERDVRSAAAYMLASYGDQTAIEPLVTALRDEVVEGAAVSSLFHLSVGMKDTRIADGLISYLQQPRDPTSTREALDVLANEFGDRRLGPIALRILESDVDTVLRFGAALAFAKVSESAADEFMARLTHPNPEVRAAAAAGLREVGDRRATQPLRAAMKDSDPNVLIQVACSLRFFGDDIDVSSNDYADAKAQYEAKMPPHGANIPDESADQ